MLPDRPSELLQLALNDLRTCEADPRYRIEMAVWHVMRGGTCYICLAGAVIANSLPEKYQEFVTPSSFDYEVEKKLRALNLFRVGYIGDAYFILKRKQPEKLPSFVPVADYDVNPSQFYTDMESLVKLLQEHEE